LRAADLRRAIFRAAVLRGRQCRTRPKHEKHR
jgi:hypothetical protein